MEELLQFRSEHSSQFQSGAQFQSRQKAKNVLEYTIIELQRSKAQFLKFSQQIGALKQTNLMSSIAKYASSGFKKAHFNLTTLNFIIVLNIIDKRIEKMRKTKTLKKNWGQQDLKVLIWLVSKYCEYKKIKNHQKELDIQDWEFIATLIPGVSADSCMFKWLSLKTVALTDYNWTQEESRILKKLVNARKPNNTKHCSDIKDWRQISKQLYNLNQNNNKCYRNPKQCRQHWTCYLSDTIKKGPWTLQQDIKLFTHINRNKGGKKWSEIVKFFEGRTENALKNRYTLIMQKLKKKYSKSYSESQLIRMYIQQNYINQFTSQGIVYGMQQLENQLFGKQELSNHYYQNSFNNLQPKQNNDNKMEVRIIDINKFEGFSNDYLFSLQPGFLDMKGSFTRIEKDERFSLFNEIENNLNYEYQNDLLFQSC